jgi:plasmid stabilization system protein ParE
MALRLRFTPRSLANLADIRAYIARQRPQAAELVRGRILETINLLRSAPRLGHIGRRPGTREIVVSGLPYIVIYRLDIGDADELIILRVVHAARQR